MVESDQLREIAVPLLAGLGGAVLGAVAGYLGALHLATNQRDRERRGAARCVYEELKLNLAKLRSAVTLHEYPDLDRDWWLRLAPTIGDWFDPTDFAEVQNAYLGITGYELARADVRKAAIDWEGFAQAVEPVIERMRKARTIVRGMAYTPEQIKVLQSHAAEEKRKINTPTGVRDRAH